MMKQSVSHNRMPGEIIHHIHHRSIPRLVTRITTSMNEAEYAHERVPVSHHHHVLDTLRAITDRPIQRIVDDRCWTKIAQTMTTQNNGHAKSRFPINQPDLSVDVAQWRFASMRRSPCEHELSSLRECLEILIAYENNRPVNRDLFTVESLNAPAWTHVPALNNDQYNPITRRVQGV